MCAYARGGGGGPEAGLELQGQGQAGPLSFPRVPSSGRAWRGRGGGATWRSHSLKRGHGCLLFTVGSPPPGAHVRAPGLPGLPGLAASRE